MKPRTTQCNLLLNHLKIEKLVTQLEALRLYKVAGLAARIYDRYQKGVPVDAVRLDHISRTGGRSKIAQYFLRNRRGVKDGPCCSIKELPFDLKGKLEKDAETLLACLASCDRPISELDCRKTLEIADVEHAATELDLAVRSHGFRVIMDQSAGSVRLVEVERV